VKNSLDISVISQAKDVWFDKIISTLNGLKIPDVTDDKGNYLKDNEFFIEGRPDKVDFTTDVPQNAVVFSCKKITAKFKTKHFRYKVAPLLVSKGNAEVKMNTIGIQFGIQFKLKTLPDGRQVPNIATVDLKVDIDRRDIKIHLFGNLLTDIGSLFEVFFKGTVVDLINKTVNFTLETGIPKATNAVLNLTDGYFPIPFVPNLVVDWETPSAAIVTSTAFEIGVKGLMFDKRIGEEDPAVAIPELPYKDASKTQAYQAFVSSYAIDGFTDSLVEVMDIEGWFNATMIPS